MLLQLCRCLQKACQYRIVSTAKQQQVINLIADYSPKNFGLESIYYKTSKDKINVYFIVNEKNPITTIGYVNSLASIAEKEFKGITIESNSFVQEKGKGKRKFKDVINDSGLRQVMLHNIEPSSA